MLLPKKRYATTKPSRSINTSTPSLRARSSLMVVAIVVICLYEWARLLAGARAPDLKETEPVWLPDYAIIEGGRPLNTVGAAALALALAKELSGEAELDRITAQQAAICCEEHRQSRDEIYVEATVARYKSIRRCC